MIVLKVSLGIPVYNEEANVGEFLERLLKQKLKFVKLEEMIVIASGCTDRTVEIVKAYQRQDKRIKLIEQKTRQGKTAADNLFIKAAKTKILVLIGADTLPKKDCLENLVSPFKDPKIGVTGARMIPLNDRITTAGYFSHLWWSLFDRVASRYFRAGEIIAFRKVVKKIPLEIGSDEVFLTDAVLSQGYQPKYVRKAVAYNQGPKTIKDVVLMRRKHNWLTFQVLDWGLKTYYPKTMDGAYVFSLFLKEVNWLSPREAALAVMSAFLEVASRILALYDFHFSQKRYLIWPRGESTKRLLGPKKRKR